MKLTKIAISLGVKCSRPNDLRRGTGKNQMDLTGIDTAFVNQSLEECVASAKSAYVRIRDLEIKRLEDNPSA